MGNRLRRTDILDTEIVDAVELASPGSTVLKSGVSIVSVVAATKRVTITGWNLHDPDGPVEPSDIVIITGNAAAGTYRVALVESDTVFTVVEAIVDATGGAAEFRFPPGAEKVGFDPAEAGNITATDVQGALLDLDGAITSGGITEAQHKTIRQLVHLAEEGGPWEGFTSGAYREVLPAASPFPTSVIWWASSAKLVKIVEKLITRGAGQKPTSIVWKVYDGAGVLLATVTDTISYSGVFETSRTRAVA